MKFVGLGFVDLVWWVGSFGCGMGGFDVVDDGCDFCGRGSGSWWQ